jgi:hypothetical protein
MLKFTIHDIAPEKVADYKVILKELNELCFLITLGETPQLSEGLLTTEDKKSYVINLEEGDYQMHFQGSSANLLISSYRFVLIKLDRKLVEVSCDIDRNNPIALHVVLNSDGEALIKKELERTFQRDFSHQTHQEMLNPLNSEQEINPTITQQTTENETTPSTVESEKNEPLENQSAPVQEEKPRYASSLTEEIIPTSQFLNQLLRNKFEILNRVHFLCHELSRGKTGDLREGIIENQTLENGAVIYYYDVERQGYFAAFRLGELPDKTEFSFFLEHEDQLVFSLYFMTDLSGKMGTTNQNPALIFKRILDFFTEKN